MRIGVISDIHGNGVALDAVLGDLRRQPVDQVVCLGDAIQGGPQPAETVARLRELACPVVMGNADAWLLTGTWTGAGESANPRQLAIRAWSLAQLSDADRSFIAGFAPTVDLELPEGRRFLCFHGSPTSFDDIVFPTTADEEAQQIFGETDAALLAGGHTHIQQLRRVGDSLFINPGSVGLAYDPRLPDDQVRVDPWAEYAVVALDDRQPRQMSVEFRRIPYDVAAVIRAARENGLPDPDAFSARYT